MKTYDWIFFDADNTLFDFTGSSRKAFDQLMLELGLSDLDNLYPIYLKWNHQVWRELEEGKITTTEIKSKRFELFFKAIDFKFDPIEANAQYLSNLVGHANLLEGALNLLNQLKAKSKNLIIITNGLKEVQKPRIRKVEITHYFESIIVSDEIGVAKPDSAFFEIAAASVGHPTKEKVLVVGDSLNSDIQGGINYGYDTCWFNLKGTENTTQFKPAYTITKLKDLLSIV